MRAYFDTSALVKLLIREDGTEVAQELWGRTATPFTGQLSYPEARAATAAAQRSGRVGPKQLRVAVAALDELFGTLRVIGVDEQLVHAAGELAERHALRGYDAVHLATALAVADERFLVVTWDRSLADAAVACGCAVAPAGVG